MSVTTNHYCDSVVADSAGNVTCTPANGGVIADAAYPQGPVPFIYADDVQDVAQLLNDNLSSSLGYSKTETKNRYDALGNPTTISVTISASSGEVIQKKTANEYTGTAEQRLGRVTKATVTSQRTALNSGAYASNAQKVRSQAAIQHVTKFEYDEGNPALPLIKTKVEADSGAPTELHTAYSYDGFGNKTSTTECATDFAACTATEWGSHVPPFRRTTTSYDPQHFNAPSGYGLISSLSYGKGRFPVMTTNAAGHIEYAAYDPLLGVVRQRTGPNGIHTCYGYDSFGRATSQTERCGISGAVGLTTTTQRFLLPVGTTDPPYANVVTVVTLPAGGKTWTYTNDQAKVVRTSTHSFKGGYVIADTTYDVMGRTVTVTKPRIQGVDPTLRTTSIYDDIGRIKSVTEELGDIDGTGNPKSAVTTTSYVGFTNCTEKVVAGVPEDRCEQKGALGKVISVLDALDNTVGYTFDADGNMIGTYDPNGNAIDVYYDQRGRKSATTDPDLGAWSYTYDGFGDVLTQTDAAHQTTTMTYDNLGRMTSKTDSSGTSAWAYDAAPNGIGKVSGMTGPIDARLAGVCQNPYLDQTPELHTGRWFTYTPFGQLDTTTECADGDTFVTANGYDQYGRQEQIYYPPVNGSQLVVGYHYTGIGHLQFVTDQADGSVLWTAKAMNALGQVTSETTSNGVETTSTRNASMGWLTQRKSIAHGDSDKLIQDWVYQYDEGGNIKLRARYDEVNSSPSEEFFSYDPLNRVTGAQTRIVADELWESYGYDALGNLTSKNGKTYTYSGCMAGSRQAGPHAVCNAGVAGDQYAYDANGNMVSGSSRTITYNAANKVSRIVSAPIVSEGNDTGTVNFIYGADENRVVQDVQGPDGTSARTVYVGLGATGRSMYERTTKGSNVQHVHFIYAGDAHGGNAFALRVVTTDGGSSKTENKFYYFDRLGSVTAVADRVGHVVDANWGGPDAGVLGYDTWGARRAPDGHPANPAHFNLPVGARQFTGHEQIPDVGLVNMNGRVYDPVLGRFLSPDPTVQFVADLQNLNRYTYVLNNPLRDVDPTGFSILSLSSLKHLGMTALTIAICSDPVACTVFMLAEAVYTYYSMVSAGAAPMTAFLTASIGFVAGTAGAHIGGDPGALGLLEGAGSSLATATLTSIVEKGSVGWKDLGQAAMQFAVGAAEGAAIGGVVQLAQADAENAEGALKKATGGVPTPPGEAASIDVAKVEYDIDRARFYESAGLVEIGSQYRELAIADAIVAYDIDVSAANGVYYDPGLSSVGLTSLNGVVTIGPQAFDDAGTLGSSIGHEAEVHAVQLANNQLAMKSTFGRNLNEAQAYSYEVANADRYGLNPYEVRFLQGQADLEVRQAMRGGYGAQVANHTYRVNSSDLYPFERK